MVGPRPIGPMRLPGWIVRGATAAAGVGVALVRSGIWRPANPGQLVAIERALRRYGQSMAALGVIAAARYPDRPGVIDELGQLTYRELDQQCERIAAALYAEYGVGSGGRVGVLCRNHRYFLMATLAASRLGADVLFLNTEFAGPQLAAVLARHRLDVVIADEEFEPLLAGQTIIRAWPEAEVPPGDVGAREPAGAADPEGGAAGGVAGGGVGTGGGAAGGVAGGGVGAGVGVTLAGLAGWQGVSAPGPGRVGRITLLTSGTTGAPKAAPRAPTAAGLAGLAASALERVGLRSGEPVVVCPPLFHGLGLLTSMLALFLGSAVVLARRFDPAVTLASVERHQAGAVLAVPIMLRRVLESADPARYDLTSLRAVMSGASKLSPELAERFIDRYGPVLCDLYGSSEVGIATIATSADLIAAPGTVGRPCLGSSVRILDEHDRPLPPGRTGRIFAGGGLVFAGYSDGSTKTVVDGRMSTGDLGHLDRAGRLFIDGREDDMIVSGGENVYPAEVEDCLQRHPAVAEAAVVGAPDEEFGQRLIAYVVLREPATPDELVQHVRANLARYKSPREVVVVDRLPRTATGKVIRRDLPG